MSALLNAPPNRDITKNNAHLERSRVLIYHLILVKEKIVSCKNLVVLL